ncbi:MAG: type II secretion system GspH family protein [Puniceicoccales bacterium]|nr:type II secretion system GspH family protein [Puniceicoccales bacterium]
MKCDGKKRGFSLIEILLVIGLSGAILVTAMTLMLSFANIYLSSPAIEAEIEGDIFAKKLIKTLLNQYKSSESYGNVDEELLSSGIFWQTDNVPIFADENRKDLLTVGLVWQANLLNFVWKSEEDVEFEHLALFDDVTKICILSYDAEIDSWSEHEFLEDTARKVLNGNNICCLNIVRYDGKETIPFF